MTRTAYPVNAADVAWIELRPGVAVRPLRFGLDGWTIQLRVDPGTTISRHRHTGEVHGYNVSGHRELIDTGEIVGPGTYVYEPPGNVDSWRCHGDEPCIIQINLTGRVEYLDEDDTVTHYSDARNQREVYLAWCKSRGVELTVPMVPYDRAS